MKAIVFGAALVTFAVGISSPVNAQWPARPATDVPRNADGTPILDAPTPRTPDGKPDLSGVWRRADGGGPGRGAGGQAPPADPNSPPVATFGDVGTNVPGGLPLQPWAAELKKQRMAVQSKDNPDAMCLPMGLTQFHQQPQPRKIIQTPKVTLIIYEA